MKYAILFIAFAVSGYFVFIRAKSAEKKTAAAIQEETLPPAPIMEVKPIEIKPVISAEEQNKIVHTTNDTDPNVRWEAMVLLDKLKAPAAYPVLFDKLRRDTELDVRLKIIKLLSQRPDPEVIRQLTLATKDMAPEVRLEALRALEAIGDGSAAAAVMECLKDTEDSVRLQALKTLNTLQDKRQKDAADEQKRQEEARRKAMEEAQKQQQQKK